MYNIVIVADQGHTEAWTLTTIIISKIIVIPFTSMHVAQYFHNTYYTCLHFNLHDLLKQNGINISQSYHVIHTFESKVINGSNAI